MIYEIPHAFPQPPLASQWPAHFFVVPIESLRRKVVHIVVERRRLRVELWEYSPEISCPRFPAREVHCKALELSIANAITKQLFPFRFPMSEGLCAGCPRLRITAPARPLAIVHMVAKTDHSDFAGIFPATRDGFCRALWGMPYEQLKRMAALSVLAGIGG